MARCITTNGTPCFIFTLLTYWSIMLLLWWPIVLLLLVRLFRIYTANTIILEILARCITTNGTYFPFFSGLPSKYRSARLCSCCSWSRFAVAWSACIWRNTTFWSIACTSSNMHQMNRGWSSVIPCRKRQPGNACVTDSQSFPRAPILHTDSPHVILQKVVLKLSGSVWDKYSIFSVRSNFF